MAITKCRELQAQPVIIHNEEQQEYWTGWYEQNNVDLILGLVCNTTTSKWEWSDGSTVDYRPAMYADLLNGNCKSGCTWVINNSNGVWGYACSNGAYTFDIYCTTQLPPLPVPSADGCESFEDDSDDGVCYQVGTATETWQDAQMICAKLGANLASIHNAQENSFVRRSAVSRGAVNGVFLGATISGKGKDYGWIDGSDWDYENFYPGFPMAGTGECLAMDTTKNAGQWMNVYCSENLPVACVREKKPVSEPTCNTGSMEENKLITSPGFPFNASIPCEFFLTAEEGKNIEVEIVFLEANSCCDFLVLHDLFLGGNMIANITGEITKATYTSTSNLMRVSWQPNGGVNVRGLAMVYRSV